MTLTCLNPFAREKENIFRTCCRKTSISIVNFYCVGKQSYLFRRCIGTQIILIFIKTFANNIRHSIIHYGHSENGYISQNHFIFHLIYRILSSGYLVLFLFSVYAPMKTDLQDIGL